MSVDARYRRLGAIAVERKVRPAGELTVGLVAADHLQRRVMVLGSENESRSRARSVWSHLILIEARRGITQTLSLQESNLGDGDIRKIRSRGSRTTPITTSRPARGYQIAFHRELTSVSSRVGERQPELADLDLVPLAPPQNRPGWQ